MLSQLIYSRDATQARYALDLMLGLYLDSGEEARRELQQELKRVIKHEITKKGELRGARIKWSFAGMPQALSSTLLAVIALILGHEVVLERTSDMALGDIPPALWGARRLTLRRFSLEELCLLSEVHAHPNLTVVFYESERPFMRSVMNLGELSLTAPARAEGLVGFFERALRLLDSSGQYTADALFEGRLDALGPVVRALTAAGVDAKLALRVGRIAQQVCCRSLSLEIVEDDEGEEVLWAASRRVTSRERARVLGEVEGRAVEEREEALKRRFPAKYARGWRGGFEWHEALEYCNRLSELEGLEPVYVIHEGAQRRVSTVVGASGYRLLSEREWEVATKDLKRHLGFTDELGDTKEWCSDVARGGKRVARELGDRDRRHLLSPDPDELVGLRVCRRNPPRSEEARERLERLLKELLET